MKPGPVTQEQLNRLGSTYHQGSHLLITGPTQSGKTTIARHILQKRIDRGGFVVMFVCKLRDDPAVTNDYKDWTRWTSWKRNPGPFDNKILLWPKTQGMPVDRALALQKATFNHALDRISVTGKWTVYVDEGLYFCDPTFMGLSRKWSMMHYLGATSKISCVTSTQRPANIPKVIYGSVSHALTGRINEADDLARLAMLQGQENRKELRDMMTGNTKHDFVWSPIGPDWPAERVNLAH